jgi:hypothetical protein
MSWEAQTIDNLSHEALVSLLEERVAAIRVPRFCTPDAAARIARFLVEHPDRANYRARWNHSGSQDGQRGLSETTDVDRVGRVDHSFQEVDHNAEVVGMMREIRAAAMPDLGPIDRLRLELDEITLLGAGLFRRNGRVSLAGIGRIMETSKELVHADMGRRGCLTANIYLRMPGDGGGTRIWDYRGDYRQSQQSYRFTDGEIPDSVPSCVVPPEVGDLVIWNPVMPHAVLPFDDPPRVTLQTWLLIDRPAGCEQFAIRLLN